MNITNAIFNAPARFDFSRNAVQSSALAAATINVQNGGQLNVNTKEANNGGNNLQLTRSGGYSTLNIYPGGVVSTYVESSLGTANQNAAGNILILPDAGSGSQATLNVLGGTVLAGIGYSGSGISAEGAPGAYSAFLSTISFFASNPTLTAASRAILNMAGGSITAYKIAMTTPGGISTNPTNGISITGGTLYLGAPNISYPAGGLGANFFFNLSGGTVASVQNWTPACSAPINLTNVNGNITFQAADINGSPFNMAFSGPFTGVGGFNKTGGGTLTLSGANNYSGASVVSGGTLAVSTINSPVGGALAMEGAINSVVIASSGQSWTIGSLTYDTGTPTADFNYDGFGPSTTVPAIQVNGNLAFNVTPQVTVEGSTIPASIYPLIKYTGSLSGTPPTTVTFRSASRPDISQTLAHQAIDWWSPLRQLRPRLSWSGG